MNRSQKFLQTSLDSVKFTLYNTNISSVMYVKIINLKLHFVKRKDKKDRKWEKWRREKRREDMNKFSGVQRK